MIQSYIKMIKKNRMPDLRIILVQQRGVVSYQESQFLLLELTTPPGEIQEITEKPLKGQGGIPDKTR